MDNFTEDEISRLYWLVLQDIVKDEKFCKRCQHNGDNEYCMICGLKSTINKLETIRDKLSTFLWED